MISQVTICGKKICCDFLRYYKHDKCQILHDGSTHQTLPIHTTFSDLDCISRSQLCQTVFAEILRSYPIMFTLCTIVDYTNRSWIYGYLWFFCTCSGEVIDVCLFEKTLLLPFSWTLLNKFFQTLHGNSLARDLHCYSRFDTVTLLQCHIIGRNMNRILGRCSLFVGVLSPVNR